MILRHTLYWIVLGVLVFVLLVAGVLILRKRASTSIVAIPVQVQGNQEHRIVSPPKGTRSFNSYKQALPYQEPIVSPQ